MTGFPFFICPKEGLYEILKTHSSHSRDAPVWCLHDLDDPNPDSKLGTDWASTESFCFGFPKPQRDAYSEPE